MGMRYYDARPGEFSTNEDDVESYDWENRPVEQVDLVEGRPCGMRIQNGGVKLWFFNCLEADPSLGCLAALPKVMPWVDEMCPEPELGMFAARFQWRGSESEIHGSRDNISASPDDGPEAGGNYWLQDGQLRTTKGAGKHIDRPCFPDYWAGQSKRNELAEPSPVRRG